MELGPFLLLFGAAVGIGTLASLLGIGGGSFIVPLLTLAGFAATTQQAVGTSSAAIVFTSLSSSIVYARRRAIDIRMGLLLMPTTAAGAWLGAYLTRLFSARWLAVAFAVFLLYPAATLLLAHSEEAREGQRSSRAGARLIAIAAPLGLLAGIAAGLFGIGGGTVMVPALTFLLGVDIRTAVATSLFVMAPSAAVAALQHGVQGNLRLDLALPLILGIVIGAQVGPRLAPRVPTRRLRQLFGLVLLYAAANMAWKALR